MDFDTLRNLPAGSLLCIDYIKTPVADRTDAQRRTAEARREAAAPSRAAGLPSTVYMVELLGVFTNKREQSYILGKCLNRAGEHRAFNPAKGTLRACTVLREGGEQTGEVAA